VAEKNKPPQPPAMSRGHFYFVNFLLKDLFSLLKSRLFLLGKNF
jgi:hypothetical protein